MALRAPLPPTHQVDLLIGFTAFFAGIFFLVTLVCELTGQPALDYSLILLGLVVVLVVLWRKRRRIIRRVLESAKATESDTANAALTVATDADPRR